eukprot:515902-Prymnesium_polylepis.1
MANANRTGNCGANRGCCKDQAHRAAEANARDEDLCASFGLGACDDSGSQQPTLDDTVDHQTRPIAQTLTWVE